MKSAQLGEADIGVGQAAEDRQTEREHAERRRPIAMPFSLSLYLLGLDVEAPMHDRSIEEIGKDWLTFTNLAAAAPGVTKQGVIVVLCSAGRKIMDGGSLKWVYNLSDLRNCIATLTTSFQLPAATFTEGCVLCLLDPLVFTGEGNGTNLDFQVHSA